jgi:RES domain-containing protein
MEFVTFEIEIPESVAIHVEIKALPRNWRNVEPSASTQGLGTDWQRSGRSAALVVPSVLVPQEYCVLLNPEHPDTDKIMVMYPEPFTFDARL